MRQRAEGQGDRGTEDRKTVEFSHPSRSRRCEIGGGIRNTELLIPKLLSNTTGASKLVVCAMSVT